MRRIIIIFSVIAAMVAVFAVAAYIFLRSPYFPGFLEKTINSRMDEQVTIGSISFSGWNEIEMHDVAVRYRDSDEPFLSLPYIRVTVSISSVIKREIDGIYIKKPRLDIDLQRKAERKAGEKKGTGHLSVRRGYMEEGEVVFRSGGEPLFHVGSVTLSMEEDVDERKRIKGKAVLTDLDVTVPVDAVLDMEEFSIEKGRAEIVLREIEKVSVSRLPFLRNMNIKGSLRLGIDISAKEEMEVMLKGSFRDVEVARMGEDASLKNASGEAYSLLKISRDHDRVEVIAGARIDNFLLHMEAQDIDLKNRALNVEARGVYDLKGDHMDLELLRIQPSGLNPFFLKGSLKKVSGGDPEIDISAVWEDISMRGIGRYMPVSGTGKSPVFDPGDRADARFTVTGTMKRPTVLGYVDVNIEHLKKKSIYLKGLKGRIPLGYSAGAASMHGAVIGIREIGYSGENKGEGIHYRFDDVAVDIPRMQYISSAVTSEKKFSARAEHAVLFRDENALIRENRILLSGTMGADMNRHLFWITDLSLTTDDITSVSGMIRCSFGAPVTMYADVTYKGIELQKLQERMNDILPLRSVQIGGKGVLHSKVTVKLPEGAGAEVYGSADLGISGGEFSSPDGTVAGEGIDMNIAGSFGFDLPLDKAEFDVRTGAGGFELMAGRFYGSFRDRKVLFSVSGEYSGGGDGSLRVKKAELVLADIGALSVKGEVFRLTDKPYFDADIMIGELNCGNAYDLFLKDTFKESFPALSRLEVAGTADMTLSVNGTPERFSANGTLNITDMDIIEKSKAFSVRDITARVPVDIEYPGVPFSGGMETYGSIGAGEISWRDMHIRDLVTYAGVRKNALIFREDIILPLLGGNIRIGDVVYRNIISPDRELDLSISMEGIELERLSRTFNLPAFSGSLSGTIPRASLRSGNFVSEGEISMELFGGEVTVNGLSVHNISGPVPSVKASIAVRDIDLGKLTRSFAFGHISGTLTGYINDLVIANGQAEGFEASLETEKRRGVPQVISVEALKNISILGAGSSAQILHTGIYRLFKKYRYRKMGFHGVLRNDTLRLSGIEREGEKEYLVKGSVIPPKVDVVSYTQNISFQEMVRRLNRIKVAGAGSRDEADNIR